MIGRPIQEALLMHPILQLWSNFWIFVYFTLILYFRVKEILYISYRIVKNLKEKDDFIMRLGGEVRGRSPATPP